MRIADLWLGIRSNTEVTDEAVRRVLASYLVDGVDAPPNFSVALTLNGASTKGRRDFCFLYRSHSQAIRSRAPQRVLRGLIAQLSLFAGVAETTALRTWSSTMPTALVKDDRALIVPMMDSTTLETYGPRFWQKGWAVVETPFVAFDTATGDLIVPTPTLEIDTAALEAIDAKNPPSKREQPWVGPGRYRVAAWAFFHHQPGPLITKAMAVVEALRLCANVGDVGGQTALDTLGKVFTDAAPLTLVGAFGEQIFETVKLYS